MCNILVTTFMLSFIVSEIKLSYAEYDIEARVTEGRKIGITHRPHIVSIYYSYTGFECGGVIVSSRWILTAQSCISKPKKKTQYYIRVGSNFHDRGGFLHTVRDMKVFNSSKVINTTLPIHNIALLKVAPRFQFSSRVLAARLPKRHGNLPDKLWVSGWGNHNLTESDPPIPLHSVSIDKVSIAECKNTSENYGKLVSGRRNLCYGGEEGSCYMDTGGPLGNRHTVYGLLSFVDECGETPGVYVKLSNYWKWIKKTIAGKR